MGCSASSCSNIASILACFEGLSDSSDAVSSGCTTPEEVSMPLEGASKALPAACVAPSNGVEGTCSPTALGRDPASAACPIVSSSASPSKAGTPETGAGKTLGLCGASTGVGGTFLTASASSSLRGAETKGAGVGGAILLAKIN